MRIMVTNDDGIAAPGIKALAEALTLLGEVTVVAPDRERSAAGHSLTLHSPLRVLNCVMAGTPWTAPPPTASTWGFTACYPSVPIWLFPVSTMAATWGMT